MPTEVHFGDHFGDWSNGTKPASTPLEPNHQLAKAPGPLFDQSDRYLRLIGKLVYLTLTRPKLVYDVHILAQFMHTTRKEHWEAVLHLVRYLKGCSILLQSDSPLILTVYRDSD